MFRIPKNEDVLLEYQRVIDDLTEQLAVAKAENERLTAECKAWDDGRDELVQSHQDEIIEYLEQIQNLLDENSHLKEIVEQHNNACLPSL